MSNLAAQALSPSQPKAEVSGSQNTAVVTPDLFTGVSHLTIPLDVPRGRGNLTPTLILEYRGDNPAGPLGVGWKLEVGAIERTRRPSLDYGSEDYLFKDGAGENALVTNDNKDFHLRVEGNFSKISKISNADGSVSWQIVDTHGTKSSYGTSAKSRQDNGAQVFRWSLDRVEDTNGNFIEIQYTKDAGQIYVDEIDYTGNAASVPNNKIKFVMEANPAGRESTDLLFPVSTMKRVKTLEVYGNGTLVCKYDLAYAQNPLTGQSQLTSITTIGSDGSSSLPLLKNTYATSKSAWELADRAGPGPNTSLFQTSKPQLADACIVADFNGDSISDIACYVSGSTWQVGISAGKTWTVASWPNGPDLHLKPGDKVSDRCFWGFFSSDTKADLACFTPEGGWSVAMNVASLAPAAAWSGGPSLSTGNPLPQGVLAQGDLTRLGYRCIPGNFDHPRLTSITCLGNDSGKSVWRTWKPEASHWSSPIPWGETSAQMSAQILASPIAMGGQPQDQPKGIAGHCLAGDFNQDHRLDLMCRIQGNQWHLFASKGGTAGWTEQGVTVGSPVGAIDVKNCIVGDFSADHTTSVACASGADSFDVLTFNGSSWVSHPWTGVKGGSSCYLGNFTGSGTTLACFHSGATAWDVNLVWGSGFTSQQWPGVGPVGIGQNPLCLTGSFDADGNESILCYPGAGTTWKVLSHPGSELLTTFTNSVGGTTTLDYATNQDFSWGIPFAVHVVKALTRTDGRGGSYKTTIDYEGPYFDSGADEFRGFNHVTQVETSAQPGPNDRATETWFHQGDSPEMNQEDPTGPIGILKGKPYKIVISDGNHQTLSKEELTYTIAQPGTYHFPSISQLDRFICDGPQCDKHARTRYKYDQYGNITNLYEDGDVDTPDDDVETQTTFAYNPQLHLVSFPALVTISQKGIKLSETKYYYDGQGTCDQASSQAAPTQGNVTRVVQWSDGGTDAETWFSYDMNGNVICVRDANGNKTSTNYDVSGTYPTRSIDALGHSYSAQYYGVNGVTRQNGHFGLVREIKDINGEAITYAYDAFGRLAGVTHADGSTDKWEYKNVGDANHQSVVHTSPAGLKDEVLVDGLRRIWAARSDGDNETTIEITTSYDSFGNVARVSLPHYLATPDSQGTISEYDAFGRLTKSTDPNGKYSVTCYKGLDILKIGRRQQARLESYDTFGRLVKVDRFATAIMSCTQTLPTPSATAKFSYDGLGRLTSRTDPGGNELVITYDSLSRRKQVLDPDLGKWAYKFDLKGNATERRDAKGQTIYYQYDRLDRVIQKDYGAKKLIGSGDIIYKYDDTNIPNGLGRLAAVKDQVGSTVFKYDKVGRIIEKSARLRNKTYLFKYTYDPDGRLNSITYPDDLKIQYVYSGPYLTEIRSDTRSFLKLSGHNIVGQPTIFSYGNGTTAVVRYFDSAVGCPRIGNEPCALSLTDKNGALLRKYDYSYDEDGNVSHITSDSGVKAEDEDFGYDLSGRLVSAKGPYGNLTFSFDTEGNLSTGSSLRTFGLPMHGVPHPHALAKVGTQLLRYDDNGNQIGSSGRVMDYDFDNRLRSVHRGPNIMTYAYWSDGARAFRTNGSQDTVYPDPTYECTNANCIHYILAGGMRIAAIRGNATLYIHRDVAGSSVLITNDAGKLAQTVSFGPYGAPSPVSGTVLTAQYWDKEYEPTSGLFDYGARYYDPALQMFITPDTFMVGLGDAGAFNGYAYCFNNPKTYVDMRGRFPLAAVIIGAAIGFFAGGVEAGANNRPWFEGALNGAFAGALFGFVGGYAMEAVSQSVVGGLVLGYTGGTVAGAVSAQVAGGNIQEGANWGGIAGLVGAGFGAVGASSGRLALLPEKSAAAIYLNQAFTDVGRGAIMGATMAAIQGNDIGSGALRGSIYNVAGSAFNSTLGAWLGRVVSGEEPEIRNGALVSRDRARFLQSLPNSPGAMTIGSTVIVDPALDIGSMVQTESAHFPQYNWMGPAFLPTYLVFSVAGYDNNPLEIMAGHSRTH